MYGKIVQMYAILESNRTVTKLPRKRNFKAKKINKIQFSL